MQMQKLLLTIDRISTFVGHAFSWLIVSLTFMITWEVVSRYAFDNPHPLCSALSGNGAQIWIGFDRDHFAHLRTVVTQAVARSCTDFNDHTLNSSG